ncbi:helix-turn-helix domain-containing protein [Brevibacillus massiliensis]|jgi:tetratricopeptide (TPR) repeat protein|uniref:helix-turn-helix domain-containing protein n=1 Tax=Brevibacillus massiliensis TaxID=1118054 RepID=UPI000474797A|nr:tetratricopeptide repeat protein [Brevibacillus massiliensis]
MTQVGKRLREFRKNLRMTQEDLAQGICNRSYVSQIEKGQVIPSPEILEQLAKRLHTDLRELWTESHNPSFTQVEIQNALRHIVNRIEQKEWEIARKWLLKLSGVSLSPIDQGIYLWAKGKIAEADRRLNEVEELFLHSIELNRKLDDPIPLIRSLDSLGSFYCNNDQPEKAVTYLNEAFQSLNRYEVSGLLRISVLFHLGAMHGKLGEYYSAIEQLHNAEHLNSTYGTLYKSGEIFMALGICYCHIKRYEEAERYNQRAVAVFEVSPDPKRLAGVYTNIGILYREMKQMEKAVEYLLKAIHSYEKQQELQGKHNASIELATAYKDLGRVEEAKQLCQSVIATGSDKVLAEGQLVLADIMSEAGEDDEALSHLENALGFFTLKGMQDFQRKTYRLLGKIHMKNKRYEQAARMYEKYISCTPAPIESALLD